MSIYRKANRARESVPFLVVIHRLTPEMYNNKVLCVHDNNYLLNIRGFNGMVIRPGFERVRSAPC